MLRLFHARCHTMEGVDKEKKDGPPEVPPSDAVGKESSLLEEFFKMPSIAGVTCAVANEKEMNLTVHWSQMSISENSRRQYVTTLHLADKGDLSTLGAPSLPVEVAASAMTSVSPSGRRIVVMKLGTCEAEGAVIEIWQGCRVDKRLVVPKSQHGAVVNDGCFNAGAAWSADESMVAYIAEGPAIEQTPEWGGPGSKSSAGPKTWRGKAGWQQDWGEQKDGQKPPSLFVLDVEKGTVTRAASGLPQGSTVGFPVWTPDGKGLVVAMWPHRAENFPNTAALLGFVYCMNRPCELHYLPYPGGDDVKSVRLTPGMLAAVCPTFSPDGKSLIFLSHACAAETGVHAATAKLCRMDWPEGDVTSSTCGAVQVVVDAVQQPESADQFPGLYAFNSGLLRKPFIDDHTLLMQSSWGFEDAVLSIDLRSGAVARASPKGTQASWRLLGARDGLVVAAASGFSTPPKVMFARAGRWDWKQVLSCADLALSGEVAAALGGMTHRVMRLTPKSGPTDVAFEAMVISGRDVS
eukprot:evm.model.scf_2613.1 EVM.evm.TU.scf_2613.1   scf_2613:735-8179(-)